MNTYIRRFVEDKIAQRKMKMGTSSALRRYEYFRMPELARPKVDWKTIGIKIAHSLAIQ